MLVTLHKGRCYCGIGSNKCGQCKESEAIPEACTVRTLQLPGSCRLRAKVGDGLRAITLPPAARQLLFPLLLIPAQRQIPCDDVQGATTLKRSRDYSQNSVNVHTELSYTARICKHVLVVIMNPPHMDSSWQKVTCRFGPHPASEINLSLRPLHASFNTQQHNQSCPRKAQPCIALIHREQPGAEKEATYFRAAAVPARLSCSLPYPSIH